MTQKCDHCNKSFNKTEVRVKCDFCDAYFHQECATQLTPPLTKNALDVIKKMGGSLSYKCNVCLKDKEGKSGHLSNKLDNLEKYMREITTQLMEIKKDLSHNMNRNNNFEKIVNSKIKKLEAENHSLRRQMNRADIIVTGLPQTITSEQLYPTVVDLAKALGLEITSSDLHLCFWIGKKSSVLVKFNNVLTRDSIMKSYRSKYDLKLNQIISTKKEQSRVYINDHHTPLVSKFRYYCRKLLRDKKVERFEMLNWDIPRAKFYYHNGKVEEGDSEYVVKLYTGISNDTEKGAVSNDNLQNPVAEETDAGMMSAGEQNK